MTRMADDRNLLLVVGLGAVAWFLLSRTSTPGAAVLPRQGINPATGQPYGAINPATGLPYGQSVNSTPGLIASISQSIGSAINSLANIVGSGSASTYVVGNTPGQTSALLNNPDIGSSGPLDTNPLGSLNSPVDQFPVNGQVPLNSDLLDQAYWASYAGPTPDVTGADPLAAVPYPFLNDPSAQLSTAS
jgi:hypothetical protein